jgi:pseudouridine-5'-phosphate glycosidase/pseudouridine kinase
MITRTVGRSFLRLRSSNLPPRLVSYQLRNISSKNSFLKVSDEVKDAINSNKPVVALETTIYTHGTGNLSGII